MIEEKLTVLCDKLGYMFTNSELLKQALTHSSCERANNERLEFLGDAILSFIIAKELYDRHNIADEGDLSRIRANLVKRETLANLSKELTINQYISLGFGEEKSGGRQRESIWANTLEAVIAAIYLDSDMETTKSCVVRWFETRLCNINLHRPQKDPKTTLQESLQSRKFPLPQYSILELSGVAHKQMFHVKCSVKGLKHSTTGKGSSRRRAEQEAAKAFLVFLEGLDV